MPGGGAGALANRTELPWIGLKVSGTSGDMRALNGLAKLVGGLVELADLVELSGCRGARRVAELGSLEELDGLTELLGSRR